MIDQIKSFGKVREEYSRAAIPFITSVLSQSICSRSFRKASSEKEEKSRYSRGMALGEDCSL